MYGRSHTPQVRSARARTHLYATQRLRPVTPAGARSCPVPTHRIVVDLTSTVLHLTHASHSGSYETHLRLTSFRSLAFQSLHQVHNCVRKHSQ